MLDLIFGLLGLLTIFTLTAGAIKAYGLRPGQSWTFKLFGREIFVIDTRETHLLVAGDDTEDDGIEEEPEEEEEEPDERMLAERLEDAGFTLIDAREAPGIDDIGSVFFDEENGEGDCPDEDCHGDLYPFGEIIGDAPGRDEPPHRALRNRYGSACDQCGRLSVTETYAPRGRFGPLVEDGLSLFDALEGFETEKREAEEGEDDAALAARQLELEGELNGIKTKRLALAHRQARLDPFRGTPTPLEADGSKKD
jgi:hypothetical protein